MEAEEAVMVNPGELQVGAEDNQHKIMDLKGMTRSINLYHSQDTHSKYASYLKGYEGGLHSCCLIETKGIRTRCEEGSRR